MRTTCLQPADLADLLLEAADFDPEDFVKGDLGGWESAETVYEDDNIRIVHPHTSFDYNELLGNRKSSPEITSYLSPEEFKERDQQSPIFVVVPREESRMMSKSPVAIQPGKDSAWAMQSPDRPMIELKSRLDPAFYQSVIQGLTQYYSGRAQRKEGAREAIRNLLMLGQYDAAIKHGRYHLPHLKDVPMGHALSTVLAMQAKGKKVSNRITRFMRSQPDVQFKDNGFYLLFDDDWEDIVAVALKTDSRRFDVNSTALGALTGDMHWYDDSYYYVHAEVGDLVDNLDDKSLDLLRRKLLGRTYVNEEGGDTLIDEETDLSAQEIKDILENDENSDEFDDIISALRSAGSDAERSGVESAYYKHYMGCIKDALGEPKHKTINGREYYAFFFPYATLDAWLARKKEDDGDELDMADVDIKDLAKAYVEKVSPNEDISHDWDEDYFNDALRDYHLAEIKDRETISVPREEPNPDQPELPLEDPRRTERPLNPYVTVRITSEAYPDGTKVRMRQSDAEEYLRRNPRAEIVR